MNSKNRDIPDHIIVDGEKINFHYNREERLSKVKDHDDENCFFCKKYRYLHIMLIDLALVAVIGIIFYNITGKNDTKKIDDISYTLNVKQSGMSGSAFFVLQIKNGSNSKKALSDQLVNILIKSKDSEVLQKKEIIISKLTYDPGEIHLQSIFINNIKKGNYKVECKIGDQSIELPVRVN